MAKKPTQGDPVELDQDEIDFQRAQNVVAIPKARPKKRVKAEKASEPFVQVPLWWIEMAARRAKSPATLVLIELLYAAWKAKSPTFPLPNVRLRKLGVSRDVKRRVLYDLERGGVILVERPFSRTPIVTLIGFGG
jgi:hypothetical protein